MAVIFAANLAALLFSFFVAGALIGVVYSKYAGDELVEFFLDGKHTFIATYMKQMELAIKGKSALGRRR